MANEIRRQLLPRLRPKYVALLAKRYVFDRPAVGVLDLPSGQIEILSPVNKRGDGVREYVTRRNDLLKTRAHLLEIDLVWRGGRIPLEGELPPAPYYAFLSRFTRRPVTEVWAIPLRNPLPVVPVPLLPPNEDVPLDLQAVVDACFDLVGYERLLNYREAPPPPPLSQADAAWIAECIEGPA